MTATPEILAPPTRPDPNKKENQTAKEHHPLESLFYLGYAKSPVIELYNDGNISFKVQFRTLTPAEIRDVTEEITKYFSPTGQTITEQIEMLARAIVHINYLPLVLPKEDQQAFFEANKRQISPLEEARLVLRDKIQSLVVLNSMYEAYMEFSNEITKQFEDAKKKSKNLSTSTPSSAQT